MVSQPERWRTVQDEVDGPYEVDGPSVTADPASPEANATINAELVLLMRSIVGDEYAFLDDGVRAFAAKAKENATALTEFRAQVGRLRAELDEMHGANILNSNALGHASNRVRKLEAALHEIYTIVMNYCTSGRDKLIHDIVTSALAGKERP